jgi:molecular chaperone HtpG
MRRHKEKGMTQQKTKKYEFQSEVKQLLNILVYSLYKNKEVFLRELVSNDKDTELRIDISVNKTNNTLIIEDRGVGMAREELIENIGTIAHSGTVDFLKKLAEAQDKEQVDLIGKFGVGFYSSFMVAEKIHIYTKSFHKESPAYLWKSRGGADYTIAETVKKKRGTRIEIFLKKKEKEFLDKSVIKDILTKYSKFVPFPIYIENEKIEAVEAIWTQPKSSLKKKDYVDFFKFFENTQEEPETYLHLSSDAPVQFNAILYIPKTSIEQFGLFKIEPGVDLFSRKVLIQKSSKDIMPDYLRFVKGVIDSEDIPLNISRETIQNNIKINKIRKYLLKRLLAHLKTMKEKDREKYLKIWGNFHRNLKEGIASDFENKEKISPLLLFHSSKYAKKEYTDLKDYIERMDKNQKEIFYISGLDLETMEKNPALEAFKQKDLEVLYLDDPLDEFVIEHLREYKGKSFKLAESADIKVDKKKEQDKDYLKGVAGLVSYLKNTYGEKVAEVKVSNRLVDSPCLLVQAADGPSVQMEKIFKMTNKEYKFAKKVLEINPDNDLIQGMVRLHGQKPLAKELKLLALQLLDNMLLREGVIEEIDDIVPRIQEIMLQAVKKATPAAKPKKKSG